MPEAHYLRFLQKSHSDLILQSLSSQQHLHPHQSLREAVAQAGGEVGFCPGAADSALRWLQLEADLPIGRLRRTQLTQLAHSIDRFWQQAMSQARNTPKAV